MSENRIKGINYCECSDPGCPEHLTSTECHQYGRYTLYRIDMDDRTGTRMCSWCAEDAMECGLFSEVSE